MDELTARLQRAATEVAERAVPAPDDIVRRGRRQRRRHAVGAVLAMALAGGVVAVPLLRSWQPAAPTGMAIWQLGRAGQPVLVVGRLAQRSWQAEDGSGRSVVEVVADEPRPGLRWATATTTRTTRSIGE